MTERGYFALYRGTLDHPIFKKERYTEAQAWVWMLEQASYKPRRQMVAGRMVDLDRGQFSHALRFMAAKFQWSEPKVRRFLTRLKTDAMIDAQSDAGQLVITVCNYCRLQPDQSESDAANDAGATQERRATDAGATQSKKRKEGKKGKREESIEQGGLVPFGGQDGVTSSASPRSTSQRKQATTWPADFDLDGDLHRYAEDAGIDFHGIPGLWERFKNHHQAKGTTFKDWRAAWRAWVGNEIKFSRERRQHGSGRPLGNGNYDTPSGRAPLVDYALSQIGKPQEPEENSFWPNKTA